MKRSLFTFFCFAMSLGLMLPALSAKKQRKIEKGNSMENLFRPPLIRSMSMSPDGKYAAGIGPIGGVDQEKGLIIYDLDAIKIERSFKWSESFEIYQHGWLDNDSLWFKVATVGRYINGLYRYDIDKGTASPLFGNDAVVSILDPNEETSDPAWAWVQASGSMKPTLVKLNKNGYTTASTRVADNPLILERIPEPTGDIYRWYIDHAHQARGLLRYHEDKLQFSFLGNSNNSWSSLDLDPEDWSIELFHHENNKIYISGYNGEETKGLYLYDLETKQISEPIFRDPYYDFSETARYLTFNDQLLGITYTKATPTTVWLAEEMLGIQNMLDSAIPNRANIIYDWDTKLQRLLVYSFSDTVPPEYLLLDLKEKAIRDISKSAPWLSPDRLSRTEIFHFKTSDGLRLEGYLNRPTSGKAPYPTVALIHGGPWARDFATFDEEAQFLATQGYAVLKINYRGSTGYGKSISHDPEYDFAAMNRDIAEAVRTAINGGIADPDRVAIMGASFGGYAAISGAAFEPDLYRCAITNMGVFDWEEMTKSRKRQRSRYSHKRLIEAFGDPNESTAAFEAISPIHHVDKIKIPIFVIHGKEDRNVSIRQSKKLKSELKKEGVVFETHFVGDEGHNIFEHKKRMKTYEQILAFLDKYMREPR
ncbi:S9 family peptidase [Pelagicoccus sp. NFK12]|uniref:S9 family peptidase n=1 Tax=Pelagicoccus enzymogenes TaxID=2773457 RepID=A0A927F728_9BACT|nr:alpha/beta fold hydrolase [Pelagicoccus enzymogenes]MBD5779059.1 S9 family peptidase [Pelagicoccus enzymogenes]MDQ8200217.1 prolyl oligopeptidase family serine peptidase [Pelagicoccus enzymogenes]